jgi:uncharacterized protein YndB with AHSA1/START domain
VKIPFHPPDLSQRPFSLKAERIMNLAAARIYSAWTEQFDTWFAAPGSVLMIAVVNTPFFFETQFENRRHPHYGRFLRLEENKLVEITWVTAGTKGVETVVTVSLEESKRGTKVQLSHAGFPDEESRKRHSDAWPLVLEQLEQRMREALRN